MKIIAKKSALEMLNYYGYLVVVIICHRLYFVILWTISSFLQIIIIMMVTQFWIFWYCNLADITASRLFFRHSSW